MTNNTCTCGCAEVHPIATRTTADMHRVKVWSDGMVTHADPFGTHIRGIGPARAKHRAKAFARTSATLAECVGFFDFNELSTLVRVVRENVWHDYSSEDARRRHIICTTHRVLAKAAKAAE